MKYSTIVFNKMSSSSFLKMYTLSSLIKKDGELYGKEILDYIKGFNTAWQPSHGTFYPALENMVKDGLIEKAYEYDSRKYYRITEIGKQYYEERAKDFKKMLLDASKFYNTIAKGLYIGE